jgi:hypothetical protein
MAHRNHGASENHLVTDADFARFQHAGGPMRCPVADAALLLDAMMSLIFRNETKRLAEAQAATGQVRLRRAVTGLKPQNRSRRSEQESSRSSPSVPRGAPQCLHLIGVEGGAPSGQSKTMPRESQLTQTIPKRECRIGACVACAVFEIVMTCSKPRLQTKDFKPKSSNRRPAQTKTKPPGGI